MEVMNTTTTADPLNMYNYLNTYMMNPIILIILAIIIIGYYVFASSLGTSGDFSSESSESNFGKVLGSGIVFILVILVLINALQYFFSINVTAYVTGLFSPNTSIDIVVDQNSTGSGTGTGTGTGNNGLYNPAPVPEIKFKKQVFNIPGNYYTYENAKALCTAYNAELATYDQIEKAYNNGAEWCNYGWSANQLALFPTQKKTYNNLQKIPGHENDCGRPGVNGGYIANENVKFGVNCYGYKPKITSEEQQLMKTSTPYPETMEDIVFEKKVDAIRNNLSKVLVSPFNYDSWGEM